MIRELIRAIQVLPKNDLPVDKRVDLTVETDEQTQSCIWQFWDLIREHVLLRTLSFGHTSKMESMKSPKPI
jgi:isoleucyl-tRNA synthetase